MDLSAWQQILSGLPTQEAPGSASPPSMGGAMHQSGGILDLLGLGKASQGPNSVEEAGGLQPLSTLPTGQSPMNKAIGAGLQSFGKGMMGGSSAPSGSSAAPQASAPQFEVPKYRSPMLPPQQPFYPFAPVR